MHPILFPVNVLSMDKCLFNNKKLTIKNLDCSFLAVRGASWSPWGLFIAVQLEPQWLLPVYGSRML